MKQTKTTLLSAARWLVVLTTSLLVLAGSVVASQPQPSASKCDASCKAKCPCCLQAPTPNSSAPLSTPSSTRTVAKDFQFAAAITWLLASDSTESIVSNAHSALSISFSSTPLFLRHRALLI
jgi:hypothetical protein